MTSVYYTVQVIFYTLIHSLQPITCQSTIYSNPAIIIFGTQLLQQLQRRSHKPRPILHGEDEFITPSNPEHVVSENLPKLNRKVPVALHKTQSGLVQQESILYCMSLIRTKIVFYMSASFKQQQAHNSLIIQYVSLEQLIITGIVQCYIISSKP